MPNKKILIAVSVFALLGVTLFGLEKTGVTNFFGGQPAETIQGPTAEEKQQEAAENAAAKKQLVETSSENDNKSPDNPTSAPDKRIDLTARQESNNSVTVFTKLFAYSSGSCELSVTNGSIVHRQTAQVIYQSEYSSCAGFSVPIDSLGKGNWSIKLTVTTNGSTDNKTISYEVK